MKNIQSPYLLGIDLVAAASHKGQNGRLLVIGGSHLFHAASLWALQVASRIVDLVHYASVPENNEIVTKAKEEFRNGIVVSRNDIDAYIEEDDCILIGPGMTRDSETEMLTHRVLASYPNKQWVIDAGALQMLQLADIPKRAILTPHHGEFATLWNKRGKQDAQTDEEKVAIFAKEHECIVLLKGEKDIVCGDRGEKDTIEGGNAGMTKGGTGDVLAGLIAALACKHEAYLSARAGSYLNKYAGDSLYKTVGPFFNASDLAAEIPKVMKQLLIEA
ncbi:NAD(P)H-hydrate dehydratase [Candidatus Woesebacteria bacterium]|nr:NAD(P)H-hydrate dehydratase [Candidatus Woesebacteria bacterium]